MNAPTYSIASPVTGLNSGCTMRHVVVAAFCVFLVASSACQRTATAPAPDAGKSPNPESLADPAHLAERTIHRRAVEAVIWGMPAVNFELMHDAAAKLGGDWNHVVYWSRLPSWKNQTLTPNPDVIYLMPTNLYGPHDNFDLAGSHVVPALIRKMHEAKIAHRPEVEIWGTGSPRRELLHVDDLADACLHLLRHYSAEPHVNIGCGADLTIRELAESIRGIVGFEGALRFNPAYPDGTPRKLLDVSRLAGLGWRPRIGLRDGLASAYAWFVANAGRYSK